VTGERWAIRILVGGLAIVAVLVALGVDVPTKTVAGDEVESLPAVALGQEVIYRLEVGVLLFYGGLIVLTPVFRGAVLGRLPIEVSARGAKFAEEVDESLKATQELVKTHQDQLDDVERRVLRARLNLDQLADQTGMQFDD
jgi:hypothetical protein